MGQDCASIVTLRYLLTGSPFVICLLIMCLGTHVATLSLSHFIPYSLSSAFVGSFILSSALGPSEMKIVFDWDRRPTCAKDTPGHIFCA